MNRIESGGEPDIAGELKYDACDEFSGYAFGVIRSDFALREVRIASTG